MMSDLYCYSNSFYDLSEPIVRSLGIEIPKVDSKIHYFFKQSDINLIVSDISVTGASL